MDNMTTHSSFSIVYCVRQMFLRRDCRTFPGIGRISKKIMARKTIIPFPYSDRACLLLRSLSNGDDSDLL